MAYPIKDFKLADLFFYKDEESLMSIFILRDIPLKGTTRKQFLYLQPIITQYFIDNKSEIWLLFLIAHSKR